MLSELTYEQFVQQSNWEDVLHINYLNGQPPFTVLDPSLNTLDNDTDRFTTIRSPITYLEKLLEPIRGHLTRALIIKTKNSFCAYLYARDVIKGRWPEAEETIRQGPSSAYCYAREVIQGRWPEAEETINQNPQWAYYYARDVIQGRWPEVAETIRQDSFCAYLYARDAIKGRWPEA